MKREILLVWKSKDEVRCFPGEWLENTLFTLPDGKTKISGTQRERLGEVFEGTLVYHTLILKDSWTGQDDMTVRSACWQPLPGTMQPLYNEEYWSPSVISHAVEKWDLCDFDGKPFLSSIEAILAMPYAIYHILKAMVPALYYSVDAESFFRRRREGREDLASSGKAGVTAPGAPHSDSLLSVEERGCEPIGSGTSLPAAFAGTGVSSSRLEGWEK